MAVFFFYIGYMVDVALWVVLLFIFSMFLSETETEGKNIFIFFIFIFFHVTLLHIIARSVTLLYNCYTKDRISFRQISSVAVVDRNVDTEVLPFGNPS